ncbi:MAG: hypothetical protein K1W34_04030 [Lachnospiraceae bacterium]
MKIKQLSDFNTIEAKSFDLSRPKSSSIIYMLPASFSNSYLYPDSYNALTGTSQEIVIPEIREELASLIIWKRVVFPVDCCRG